MSTEDQTNIDDVESNYDDIDDIDVDIDVEDVQENEPVHDTKPNVNIDDEDDDDVDVDDDDDDPDAERTISKKHYHIYHQIPESTEIKIVPPHLRITSEYMTLYEYSIIVGTRATHISEGSVLYTDPEGLFDPRDIAKKEINENKCPLSVSRKISPTAIEVWEVNEMIKPQL